MDFMELNKGNGQENFETKYRYGGNTTSCA